MNILDENIIASQRQRLRSWRILVRQIGVDIAHKGLQDEEILLFLQHLRRPTFFTRDRGFYRREVCHQQFGLVCLEVRPEEVAIFVRRLEDGHVSPWPVASESEPRAGDGAAAALLRHARTAKPE
jgi:hypothetical protein